jgi:NAD(P)-dependent dehydrogenase (short-subunit alcohol dehydrogenase family)
MDTNLFGVVHGIATFLPTIRASASAARPAAIVITGSKQGITNPPGNPAYNASKAAVKILAEQLSYDLRPAADQPTAAITVHLLVPGWTYTGLSGSAPGRLDGKPPGAWSPAQVVDFLQAKMQTGQFYVLCPDNEVTENVDRRRMVWGVGDAVEGRPPLTRWREEWKERAEEGMAQMKM